MDPLAGSKKIRVIDEKGYFRLYGYDDIVSHGYEKEWSKKWYD